MEEEGGFDIPGFEQRGSSRKRSELGAVGDHAAGPNRWQRDQPELAAAFTQELGSAGEFLEVRQIQD